MTMPQGPGGLNTAQWLQQHQGNASPPTDPWISDFTTTNTLSALHTRTEGNIRQYYEGQLPGFDWWQTLLDTFSTIVQAIPEWLNEIKDVLIWLGGKFTGSFQAFFNDVFTLFKWISDNVGFPLFQGVTGFLGWLWSSFGSTVDTFLKPVISLIKNVWDFFVSIATSAGTTAQTWLAQIFAFFGWLWQNFGSAVDTFLKPVLGWLSWLWSQFSGSVETLLKPIFTFLKWVMGLFGANALQELFAALKGVVNNFGSFAGWIASLPGVNDILSVVQSLTGTISETLAQAVTGLVSWAQNLPFIGPLISAITQGAGTTLPDLIEWTKKQLTIDTVVPAQNLIGDIPNDLISLLPIGHIGDAQPNLVSDQGFSSDAAFQSGSGWSWDGSVSAPGSSGGSAKMVGDGGKKQLFSNLVQVAPGQKLKLSAKIRWTKSLGSPNIAIGVRGYTNSLVKFTTDVAVLRTLATHNSSDGVGAYLNPSPYTADATDITATYADGWVTLSGTYTVPKQIVEFGATQPGIDSIRMYLGCANTVSGLTVWFDEAVMRKTSLLPQDLVSELTRDLGDKLPGTDFNQLLNTIANQTGATLTDVEAALAEYLTSGSDLNGSNIKYGNITSAFISELTTTWSKIYYGITNGSNAAADEIAKLKSRLDLGTITAEQYTAGVSDILTKYPTASLQDFVTSMANQGSLLQSNISKIAGLQTVTGGLDLRMVAVEGFVKTLRDTMSTNILAILELQKAMGVAQKDIKDLQVKTSTPVTTPPPTTTDPGTAPTNTPTAPTTPTKVIAEDTFDRLATSLGGNWSLAPTRNPDGSVLQTDGNNAVVVAPALSNTFPQWAAVWAGSGSQSATKFQRVYATMGSQGGVPLIGGVGYNDLIARIGSNNPLIGVVARFYADGSVRIFARTGAWEDNIYTPSVYPGAGVEATRQQAPISPITATAIELQAGVNGDMSQFRARVGTWYSNPVTMPANVMSVLGNGWGMGFGNGWGGTIIPFTHVPQLAGSYNIWGAADQ